MPRKICSLALVILILFTIQMPISAKSATYSDVKTSDWFYGSLGTMSEENIISGYPDGTFRAGDTLKVDQYLAMLCRLTDNDVGLGDSYWAQNYIDFAKDQGWLVGMDINDYGKPINRYETSRLTTKALGYTLETYPADYYEYKIYIEDYNAIPFLYRDDVLVNYAIGITRGYPNGTFQGANTLTRAEGAVISHRVFDPDVRKVSLFPEKTAALMTLLPPMIPALMPLLGEVVMPGPVMMFPVPSLPMPLPIADLPLLPNVAVITENILADSIIEIADMATDNQLAAGYNYGLFNINLMSKDNESLLLFTAESGNSIIIIDLLMLTDDDGDISSDAVDFLRLICQNIDYDNSEAMLSWIITNYRNRDTIPAQGNDSTFGDTLMGISSKVLDHNMLKVTISTSSDSE